MDESTYRFLVRTALALTVIFVAVSIYDCGIKDTQPGDFAYQEADNFFEDGRYDKSLEKYNEALTADSANINALRGKARSLMQLKRFNEALKSYDLAVTLEPGYAATYANRGILHDRMRHYQKALADYDKALELDPKINEGPHWLTRFMRNQPEKPPGVTDRANYLREQLTKPENERLLRVPELDSKQRSYKQ